MNTHNTGVTDEFALALLRAERELHPGHNVVVSPLSVSLALGLILNGSRGSARRKTASALGFGPGRSLRGINETFAQLRASLTTEPELDLQLASSLIACRGSAVKPKFASRAQQYFDARIRLLDLDDPSAPLLMNSFICQRTQGKIPSVISALDGASDGAQMIMLDAVYFHGLWTSGFDPALTERCRFLRLDGSESKCSLMFKQGSFNYHGNLKYQAVRLPYGLSGRFALYLFLPLADGEFGMERMLADLADMEFSKVFKKFSNTPGRVHLPRFKTEYSSTLNDSLKRLGVEEIFDPSSSDFSALFKGADAQRLLLKHKTVVEIDERAAELLSGPPAPNTVRVKSRLIMGGMPFHLKADRPFCFFVRDDLSETINLAGYINDAA